jgi:VanZ family protein
MATLTILNLLPPERMDIKTPPMPHLDKWVHFTFYAVGMTLGMLFLRGQFRKKASVRAALVSMAVALLVYGMVIEVIQATGGSDRSAEWGDVGANSLGILFGGWLSHRLFRTVSAFNWED